MTILGLDVSAPYFFPGRMSIGGPWLEVPVPEGVPVCPFDPVCALVPVVPPGALVTICPLVPLCPGWLNIPGWLDGVVVPAAGVEGVPIWLPTSKLRGSGRGRSLLGS